MVAEDDYSMIHLQNQEEGKCWNTKVKAGLVLMFVVGLCVALILTIIIPLRLVFFLFLFLFLFLFCFVFPPIDFFFILVRNKALREHIF